MSDLAARKTLGIPKQPRQGLITRTTRTSRAAEIRINSSQAAADAAITNGNAARQTKRLQAGWLPPAPGSALAFRAAPTRLRRVVAALHDQAARRRFRRRRDRDCQRASRGAKRARPRHAEGGARRPRREARQSAAAAGRGCRRERRRGRARGARRGDTRRVGPSAAPPRTEACATA